MTEDTEVEEVPVPEAMEVALSDKMEPVNTNQDQLLDIGLVSMEVVQNIGCGKIMMVTHMEQAEPKPLVDTHGLKNHRVMIILPPIMLMVLLDKVEQVQVSIQKVIPQVEVEVEVGTEVLEELPQEIMEVEAVEAVILTLLWFQM